MSRSSFLFSASLWLGFVFLSFTAAEGEYLSIDVKDFACKDGKYFLQYGVINKYTYDRDLTIVFKVLKNEEVVACQTVRATISGGADGSENSELVFDAECTEGKVSLKYRIFEPQQRNRVGAWSADCPD
jgi:hypothetical protein